MAELLPVEHRVVGRELATLSGVDVAAARPAAIRLWEARGLALIALAAGDMAEAQRVMAHATGGAA